jgi:hypothetical protein
MSKGQFRLQVTYVFLFILSLFAIVGSVELGQEVPGIWKTICIITGALTFGKIIYLGGSNL